jgi:putative aldouronate transport system substrate-binding protein
MTVLSACAPQAPAPAQPAAPAATKAPAPAATQAPAPATSAPAVAAGKCQMDWKPTWPQVKKYDPPIKIKAPFHAGVEFKKGDDWTNNPMYNRVKEQLGIQYEIHWQAAARSADYYAKLNADLASNSLPDLFPCWDPLLTEELISSGAVEEISAIWEATASPLNKEKRPRDHPMWAAFLKGDRLYGVPWTNGPAHNSDATTFIRQDWLEKLNLKAPTTIAELEEVMRAFIKGKLAQYGLLLSPVNSLADWSHGAAPVFGAYGCMPTAWRPDGKGGLEWGSIQPKVKDVLALLNKWYKDGLLDPEFFALDGATRSKHKASGLVGVYCQPWWEWQANLEKLEMDNPGWKFADIGLPAGPDGKRGRMDSRDFGSGTLFRKGLEPAKIKAAIEELNWHMERHANWEKYQMYGEWRNGTAFVEGYEWEWNDKCELKTGFNPNLWAYMVGVGFSFLQCGYPAYQYDIAKAIKEWYKLDPAKLNKAQRYLMSSRTQQREADSYLAIWDTADKYQLRDLFWGVPSKQMVELLPELKKMETQAFVDLVSGKRPLNDFEQYVADWKKQGGDKITADVNAWYATQPKKS